MPAWWDRTSLRYRDVQSGRFVARQGIQNAIDESIAETASRMKSLATQLQAHEINIAQFELDMRDLIRTQHLFTAAIAQGGRDHLSPADLGRIGADTKKQYQFLANMARQIESGAQPLNGQFLARVEQYARASRGTFNATERRVHEDAGFDEEKNVLHPAEHCAGCLEQNARGWVPIGELVPIGQRICRVNDRCDIEYRKAA
jgi:hypothetical protein